MSRTTDRLRRVLQMVPWLVSLPAPPKVQEVCSRFGITPDQLSADLELLFMCGVHPFTPDALIEAFVHRDRVHVRSDLFPRAPRPEPAEALALVAAARAAVQTPGAPDALRRGLEKLEAALPGGLGRVVAVDLEPPGLVAGLRAAVEAGRQVDMEYFSYARDAVTKRRVDPSEVFTDLGSWYLAGWCHRAGAPRLFRVDRIRDLDITDQPASRAAEAKGLDPRYSPGADDLRVTLRLGSGGGWVRDYYPLEFEEALPDGGWRVVIATASPEWLTRLLVRLGPHARVHDPPEVAAAVAQAATRILARYQ